MASKMAEAGPPGPAPKPDPPKNPPGPPVLPEPLPPPNGWEGNASFMMTSSGERYSTIYR